MKCVRYAGICVCLCAYKWSQRSCTWSRASLSSPASVAGCHEPISFNTLHLLGWIWYLKIMDWKFKEANAYRKLFPEVIFHEQSVLMQTDTHPPPWTHVFTGYGQRTVHTQRHVPEYRRYEQLHGNEFRKYRLHLFFNWMQSSAVSQRRNYFAKRWYSLIKFYIFVITADLLQQKIFSSWILWINTSSGQAPFLTTKIFYVTFCHKLKFMFYQIWYKTSLEVPL